MDIDRELYIKLNGESFDTYQDFTELTASYPEDMGIYYTALGLTGEAGEYADKIKKVLRDSKGVITPETKESLKKELGDVIWYVARCCEELNVSMSTVTKINIRKLLDRLDRDAISGSGDNR